MMFNKTFTLILCLIIFGCTPEVNKKSKRSDDGPTTTEAGPPVNNIPALPYTQNNATAVTNTTPQNATSNNNTNLSSNTITQHINGTLKYERVTVDEQGKLSFNGENFLPIRYAKVQVVLPGTIDVIDETYTNEFGEYSLTVNVSQLVQIIVSAESDEYNLQVENNDDSDLVYSIRSNAFNPYLNSTNDYIFRSGWHGDAISGSYANDRESAPFAILDTVISSCKKLRDNHIKFIITERDFCTLDLKLNWSANSTTNIITKFNYVDNEIYIRGLENVDTDEYDEHVLNDVFIKYFLKNYSRNESLNGVFSATSILSLSQAFTEGFAQAVSAILLENVNYSNTGGARGQSPISHFNLENANEVTPNPYSVNSIREFIWDMWDQTNGGNDQISIDLDKILVGVKSGNFTQNSALASIYSFTSNFLLHYSYYDRSLKKLADSFSFKISDEYGSTETNDLAGQAKLPYYQSITVDAPAVTLAFSGSSISFNESKNVHLIRFKTDGTETNGYQIQLTSTSDIFIELFDNGSIPITSPQVPILPSLSQNINLCNPSLDIDDEYLIRLSDSVTSTAPSFTGTVRVVRIGVCP